MKNYNFCNNCGKLGHLFHQCKMPITSIGIIAYRINNNTIEYLLIRRKDSLGFVDFLRGKYNINNKEYILNLINKMTINEKNFLLNATFKELWNHLWGDNVGIQYRSEEKISYEKFQDLINGIKNEIENESYSLKSLIDESNKQYINYREPEWGFPKGRRNYQEKDIQCALREFEEETGYDKSQVKIIQNLLPLEEIYTGSNFKSYKHKYFIAEIENNLNPITNYQETEVSCIVWKSLEDTINYIREYNLEKIYLIEQVNKILSRYNLYS